MGGGNGPGRPETMHWLGMASTKWASAPVNKYSGILSPAIALGRLLADYELGHSRLMPEISRLVTHTE